MGNPQETQKQQILKHLQQGRSITPQDALNIYGCFRLAAVINRLRDEGHEISTTMVKGGKKRWASYRLIAIRQNQYYFA